MASSIGSPPPDADGSPVRAPDGPSGPPDPVPPRPAGLGPAPPRSSPGGPGTPVMLPEGWVGKVTDKIVSTVDGVRAKTTTPIEKIGRVVVWGLLIATAGIGLLIVLLIGGLRLVYEAVGNIPGINGREGRSVWMIDILFGVVLIPVGLLFIKKGTKPPHED